MASYSTDRCFLERHGSSVLPKVEQFSTEEECLELESMQPFRIEWRLDRKKGAIPHLVSRSK